MTYNATGIVMHPVTGTPVTTQPRVRVYALDDFAEFSPGTPVYAAADGTVDVTGLDDETQYGAWAFLSRAKPVYVPLHISAASLVAGAAFGTTSELADVVSSASPENAGVSTLFARADHVHKLGVGSVTTPDIADGNVTPAKLADYLFAASCANPNNFSGDGTAYTLVASIVHANRGSAHGGVASDTYTVPVTGSYKVHATFTLNGLTSNHTHVQFTALVNSDASVYQTAAAYDIARASNGEAHYSFTLYVAATASDILKARVEVSGTDKVVDLDPNTMLTIERIA
jgi:hypothetical protein